MAKAKQESPENVPGAAAEEGPGAAGPAHPDDALGYEQARAALLEVVRELEAGSPSLEESLALWERGERLARVCQRWLDGARARLDAVLAESDAEASGDATAENGKGSGNGGDE